MPLGRGYGPHSNGYSYGKMVFTIDIRDRETFSRTGTSLMCLFVGCHPYDLLSSRLWPVYSMQHTSSQVAADSRLHYAGLVFDFGRTLVTIKSIEKGGGD